MWYVAVAARARRAPFNDYRRQNARSTPCKTRRPPRPVARGAAPATRIALTCSWPDWIAARLVADHGDDAEPLARALNQRAPMTVRANTIKTDRAALAAALAAEGIATTPGKWIDTALHLETRTNLFGTQAFKRGELEAQDEGSQLLAALAVPASTKGVV